MPPRPGGSDGSLCVTTMVQNVQCLLFVPFKQLFVHYASDNEVPEMYSQISYFEGTIRSFNPSVRES